MSCFDNLLALREGCSTTTSSGYYLEDFNLNKTEIADIITSETQTIDTFVAQKIAFNIDAVTNDLVNHFSQVRGKTLIRSHRVGIWNKNKTVVAGDTTYRGIHFSMCENGNYLEFHVAEISTFTDFSGSLPVVIYDLLQNKLLSTVTVTSTADVTSTAFPRLSFYSNKQPMELFIGYDSSGINSYKTTIRSSTCCGNYKSRNGYMTSQGASISGDFINDNVTGLTDTAGVSVLYSLSCDNKGWLCPYNKQIALAVGYKVCSDIMQKGYTSSPNTRSGNTTTLNRESLRERHEWYEMKYRETMDNLMKNIRIPTETECFSCSQAVTHKIVLP